jgi:D-alanine-D-alanine ligase-like ATP-grasp enzyme
MRICILTYDDRDLEAPHPEVPVPCDPRPFVSGAEWDEVQLEKASAVRDLVRLSQNEYDVYFNFCDGSWDSDAPGIEVVQTLERLDVPFTGADSRFFDPSREAMKRVCAAWGIDTPGYVMARNDRELQRAADTLRFPLIVKHPASYSSIGLTRDSRVTDAASLARQAREMIAHYGAALVEEFIEGEEATVLVAENAADPASPITYQPVLYHFPEGETFKHYNLKWFDYHGLQAGPVRDPDLEERLRDVSARMFAGLEGTGFGRCDVRIDPDGRIFMLEINPNCGVYYPASDPGSADLCLLHDPAGHVGFTRALLDAAMRRPTRRDRLFEIRSDGNGGYGHFATRPIPAGEPIVVFEETPHTLVTRSRVERCWGERDLSWFRRYAWPITDEVWVTWSRNPEEWRPINHSCEPNAWIRGLDVVARTDIRPDEEITLDYATFYNELMPSFRCECGASTCRRTITGDDHLADFVARYGDHVSDYVRRRRNGAAAGVGGHHTP